MTPLTQFLPYVLPYALGAPEPMALQELRTACIEFCNTTLLDQEIATATATANKADYEIAVPPHKALTKILGVLYQDTWLTPTPVESVRSALALRGNVGSATVQAATPETYFQKTPTSAEISLYPVPDVTTVSMLTIRAAFAPARTATQVEDFLFDDWVDVIAAGALWKLAAVPGQSYTNPDVSARAAAQFNSALRSASIQARTGQIAAASRVRPRSFA